MDLKTTRNFKELWTEQKRINLFRGGARSSKTTSIMQAIFLWLITGMFGNTRMKEGTFSVIRATFPALRATVLKEFEAYLFAMNVYHLIDHSKTTHTFRYKSRDIQFFSADDSEKLKGRQHLAVWFNEADSCQYDHFYQAAMRTDHFLILDYNPSNPDSWVKTELEENRLEKKGDVKLVISTIYDNPFLPRGIVEEIEGLKDIDSELYKVYTLGEWARLTGLIYPNHKIVDSCPFIPETIYYGIDFGFTDPLALVQICQAGRQLYLKQKVYQREMTAADLINYIRDNEIIGKKVADASSPRFIEELRRGGVSNLRPSKKGPDSILQGIQLLRQFHLYIDSGSPDLVREIKSYKWDKNSEGQTIQKPIDAFNHALDAARYAVSMYGKRAKINFV